MKKMLLTLTVIFGVLSIIFGLILALSSLSGVVGFINKVWDYKKAMFAKAKGRLFKRSTEI